MLFLGSTALAGTFKSKLFTASTTFVVPADVYRVWVDGSAGGGGGAGGDSSPGGGGGGGGAGLGCIQYPLAVTPGETLTITVGDAGTGGGVGANGGTAGNSGVSGALDSLILMGPNQAASKASGTTGGTGGGWVGGSSVDGSAGGAINVAGTTKQATRSTVINYAPGLGSCFAPFTCGAGGGGLNANGGLALSPREISYNANGGTGGASGGGGGGGGSTQWGKGGTGGSNGSAGSNATGYGAGGGGGSGNSGGGNGSPGFISLFMVTRYTI